jgi:hypothetical protein
VAIDSSHVGMAINAAAYRAIAHALASFCWRERGRRAAAPVTPLRRAA